jgi:hypothetical protein
MIGTWGQPRGKGRAPCPMPGAQLTSYESLQPPTFLENGLKKLCQSSSEMIVRQIFKFRYKSVIFASPQQSIFFFFFYLRYSTLFHLPPLRFHRVGGCWDRTQDSCDYGNFCDRIRTCEDYFYRNLKFSKIGPPLDTSLFWSCFMLKKVNANAEFNKKKWLLFGLFRRAKHQNSTVRRNNWWKFGVLCLISK